MKESVREAMNERGILTVEQELEAKKAEAAAQTAAAEIARAEVLKAQAAPKLEMTPEQLQALMQQMIGMSTQAAIAAVQELKKPTEDEIAAKEKKRLQAEKEMQMMLQISREETANRAREQNSCPHKKQNGMWNYGGQVLSNGRVCLICKRCQKQLVDRAATPEDHQMGPLELLVENQQMGVSVQ